MPAMEYRPILKPVHKSSVDPSRIAGAVRSLAKLRKDDPATYRKMVAKTGKVRVRIVPDGTVRRPATGRVISIRRK